MPRSLHGCNVLPWLACLALVPLSSVAEESSISVRFSHHDWELVCDNTRTCRAAGYQKDDNDAPVSVLLTRKAGAGEAVTGQVMLGQYDNPISTRSVFLRIDDREVGEAVLDAESGVAALSPAQVAALLQALPGSSRILFEAGDSVRRWSLSDRGAAAVLLKMDDIQGRIGTTGALIRRGEQSEANVLPPLPPPTVHAASIAAPRDDDTARADDPDLRSAIVASLGDDDNCEILQTGSQREPLTVIRLSDDALLVSTLCWRGAYNEGYGYWVVAAEPPYRPRLVTAGGTSYDDGEISASQRSRGLGDCWWSASWIWDGEAFVQASEATTGMCRMVALGGAWQLPTLVTDVRR